MVDEKIISECIGYSKIVAQKARINLGLDDEDIVSESDELLANMIVQYDEEKNDNFFLWFRTRINWLIKNLYSKKTRKTYLFSMESKKIAKKMISNELSGKLRKKENIELLHSILKTLSTKQRKIIILKYFDSLTNKDIAEILGYSEPRISQILQETIEVIKNHPDSKFLEKRTE